MIKNSLDWDEVETKFKHQIKDLSFKNEILKIITNIRNEISDLSRAEILARRGKKLLAQELVLKINKDIELIEEYILMATIIG